MMTEEDGYHSGRKYAAPADYRIVVSGQLPDSYSDRLSGMSVSTTRSVDGETETTLEGLIQDQSELSGVLATLQGLQLPILDVERVHGASDRRK